MSPSTSRRVLAALSGVLAAVLLAGCASGPGGATAVRLGWAGAIPPLDPAASASVSSFAFLSQVYPSLLSVQPGEPDPVPEIAESAEWTSDGVFTVVLKPDLEFANGDALTTSDVRFSIERQVALRSEDGAWRQLENLEALQIVDETTVEFHLGTPTDTRFPFALAGPAGFVLDEEAFFADELTPDEDILEAQPFAGAFTLEEARGGTLVLTPYAGFAGGRRALSTVEVHLGEDAALAQQLQDGALDAVTGRLDTESAAALARDEAVDRVRAASGRARLLVFDLDRMPFGSRSETPDAGKALAVRQAIADVVDREALTEGLRNSVRPLTGYIADGVPGAAEVLDELRGDGAGGPDEERAAATLEAAGIVDPVPLTIHVDLGQVGSPGRTEVERLAEQLDASGLFAVTVVETDADGLDAARLAGEVQAAFTSVAPADSDPQGYLAMFRSTAVAIPGYGDATVDGLLAQQRTELDPDVRADLALQAQAAIATQLPAIPLTQGVRVVFARAGVSGTDLEDGFALDLSRLRR